MVSYSLVLAGESDKAIGEIYFISEDRIYTGEEIVNALLKALDKKVISLRIPAPILYLVSFVSELIFKIQGKASPLNVEKIRDVRQKNWACSIEKAKKELNYSPKVSLEDGMRKTIEWYVENKWI